MDLLKLDITQCPNEYYVQNAFKDTHRCDRKTSYVSKPYFYKYGTFSMSSKSEVNIDGGGGSVVEHIEVVCN